MAIFAIFNGQNAALGTEVSLPCDSRSEVRSALKSCDRLIPETKRRIAAVIDQKVRCFYQEKDIDVFSKNLSGCNGSGVVKFGKPCNLALDEVTAPLQQNKATYSGCGKPSKLENGKFYADGIEGRGSLESSYFYGAYVQALRACKATVLKEISAGHFNAGSCLPRAGQEANEFSKALRQEQLKDTEESSEIDKCFTDNNDRSSTKFQRVCHLAATRERLQSMVEYYATCEIFARWKGLWTKSFRSLHERLDEKVMQYCTNESSKVPERELVGCPGLFCFKIRLPEDIEASYNTCYAERFPKEFKKIIEEIFSNDGTVCGPLSLSVPKNKGASLPLIPMFGTLFFFRRKKSRKSHYISKLRLICVLAWFVISILPVISVNQSYAGSSPTMDATSESVKTMVSKLKSERDGLKQQRDQFQSRKQALIDKGDHITNDDWAEIANLNRTIANIDEQIADKVALINKFENPAKIKKDVTKLVQEGDDKYVLPGFLAFVALGAVAGLVAVSAPLWAPILAVTGFIIWVLAALSPAFCGWKVLGDHFCKNKYVEETVTEDEKFVLVECPNGSKTGGITWALDQSDCCGVDDCNPSATSQTDSSAAVGAAADAAKDVEKGLEPIAILAGGNGNDKASDGTAKPEEKPKKLVDSDSKTNPTPLLPVIDRSSTFYSTTADDIKKKDDKSKTNSVRQVGLDSGLGGRLKDEQQAMKGKQGGRAQILSNLQNGPETSTDNSLFRGQKTPDAEGDGSAVNLNSDSGETGVEALNGKGDGGGGGMYGSSVGAAADSMDNDHGVELSPDGEETSFLDFNKNQKEAIGNAAIFGSNSIASAKLEAKLEGKLGTKPEAKSKGKLEIKSEAKSEAKSVMKPGTIDPENYLNLIHPDQSLFKQIETRYSIKARDGAVVQN